MTLGTRFSAICMAASYALAQSPSPISTSMTVPPLQWLNLGALVQGSPPQPLKDTSIGYDENTRTLVIFGGESQAGLPQRDTYLLDMDALAWSTPAPKVAMQSSSPPPRSRTLGTGDFAANSRRDFLVYGGRGAANAALGDVWAYDYLNQFWVNVTLSGAPPPARWGAVGGIDPAVIPGSGNNVNTTFYVAGGSDGGESFPASDVWQLVVTGTLASDVMDIQGLWQEKALPSPLPGKAEAGGAVVSVNHASGSRIVVSGGCASPAPPLNASDACVDPATYVLTVTSGTSVAPGQCPAPRLGPAIVPNLNPSSSSFISQAFMLLGTFDPSQWNDSGGLAKGEVAVLDADAGVWARVLPAGDPGSQGGTPTFPSPRDGAAALSFPSALVGGNRENAADTIVFGGRDSQGKYLNDLWILRAYNGNITHSGDRWSGFGNGNLETGISASGAGVSVQYLSQCAQQLKATTTSSSPSPSPNTTASATTQPGPTTAPSSTPPQPFDVSIVHKLLSPLSISLALAVTILARLSSPTIHQPPGSTEHRGALAYIAVPAGVVTYAIGVAGFATSLSSTTRSTSGLQRRDGASSDTFLKTSHGRAGFVLFLGLYGLVPALASCLLLTRWRSKPPEHGADDDSRKDSDESGALAGEKEPARMRRAVSPAQSAPEVHSAESSMRDRRRRAHSGPGMFPGWTGREMSESSESGGPSAPAKGFEVVNRPHRASGGMSLYPPLRADKVRSLSDISWLERRRSLGAVGELDYALSQLGHLSPRSASPPATSRPPTVTMSTRPFVRTPPPTTRPHLDGWVVALHALFHAFLLANCISALVALFARAPIAAFAVMLVWTLAFYVVLFVLAWNGRPRGSVLVYAIARVLPAPAPSPVASSMSPVAGSTVDGHTSPLANTPTPGGSPYVFHQPPWRRAFLPGEDAGARADTVEADDPDDDEDEDDRQRHMEEELERRDVNIVTVPRKKLWITNPS